MRSTSTDCVVGCRVRAYVTTLLLMQVETNIYGEYSDPLTVAVP
jgi:hypothetical protein